MFMGKYFDKPGLRFRPILEKPSCTRAAGQFEMPRQQTFYEFRSDELAVSELSFENWLEIDWLEIDWLEIKWLEINRIKIAAFFGKVSTLVENVSYTAAHAGGKIPAARPEHQDQALGHVFAAVVADAFDDGSRSGVANGKALARNAVEKCFAVGGAVEGHIPDQNIFFGSEDRTSRRIDNQASTGQSLAHIIVGIAFQRQRDSLGEERTETLPRRSLEMNSYRVVGQSGGPMTARNRSAQHGSYRAVNIAHLQIDLDRSQCFKRIVRFGQ